MKTLLRHIVLLCVLALPAALHAQTGAVTATARVDSTHYMVGDPIAVHVLLHHPAGTTLRPAIPDSLDAFQVLAKEPLQPQADTLTATTVVVARYDSGSAPVPPLQFVASMPGDSARVVATNAVDVTVHTVSVDTTLDIKDVKPPLSIPISLAELALYALIVLMLAVAGYFIYRWWIKRGEHKEAAPPPPPPRLAHVLALEELSRLKEEKLWQRGLIKEYYTGVTDILRRYIERRYRVQALEETTDEIMQSMQRSGAEGLQTLEPLLRRADLVKFARYQPGPDEHTQTWDEAYGFVQVTMPGAPDGEKEGNHAVGA